MPWLADLVQSSEGSLDVLPVQCLCEFLLHDAADESTSGEEEEEGESKDQRAKKRQVSSLLGIPSVTYFLCIPDLIPLNWPTYHSTETTETKAVAWTFARLAVGTQSRWTDNLWGAWLLPAAPEFLPGGFPGPGHEGEQNENHLD